MTTPPAGPGSWLRWFLTQARDAVRDAGALLMPIECAGCQSHDRGLCSECARSLVAAPTVHATPDNLRVYSALRYEGAVRRILLAFKNDNRTDQARALSRALVPAIRRALDTSAGPGSSSGAGVGVEAPILIVAVPTSKRAYRMRGYDPVALVLRAAGIRHERVLRVAKRTASQKLLGAQQRALNVQGAFVSTRWLAAARVIVVDDVLTTGATIDEASRAISAAGGTVIAAATIGFTPRTGVPRDNASGEGYGKEKGAQ